MHKLILLSLLAFGADAAVSQDRVEARCFGWGTVAGFEDKDLKRHLVNSKKTLSEMEVVYEVGIGEGYVMGASTQKNQKKFAYDLYIEHCLEGS